MPYTTWAPNASRLLGPVDVGLLVEARLQLDHHHHLLAAARRASQQQVHQHRVGAGAVDRLLDRQHLRVVHRLAQQATPPASNDSNGWCSSTSPWRRRSNIDRRRRHAWPARPACAAGSAAAGAATRSISCCQPHQVDRAIDAVQRLLRSSWNCSSRKRDSDSGHEVATSSRTALAELALRAAPGAAPGAGWCTSSSSTARSESRVTRNCENRLDLPPGEQLVQVRAQHAGQQHEALRAAR